MLKWTYLLIATFAFSLPHCVYGSRLLRVSQVTFSAPPGNAGPPSFNFAKVVPIPCPVGSSCYGKSGQVKVEVTINAKGIPIHVSALSGDPLLKKPVEDAVMQYRFWLGPSLSGQDNVKEVFSVIVPAANGQTANGQIISVNSPVSTYDQAPVLIHKESLKYSPETAGATEAGVVILALNVDTRGNPSHIRVLHGVAPGPDEAAFMAVSRDRFKPAMKNGLPVAVMIWVRVFVGPNAESTPSSPPN